MRFSFHPDADAEFNSAVAYYEQCQPGLGLEFAEEVYATIMRIIEYPDAWSVISKNTCRCLTNRFPYGLIYQVKQTPFASLLLLIFISGHVSGEGEQSRTIEWMTTRNSTLYLSFLTLYLNPGIVLTR